VPLETQVDSSLSKLLLSPSVDKPIVKSSIDWIDAASSSVDDDVEVRQEFSDHNYWNTMPTLNINDLLADYL
jgi:hypothetical protein